MNKLIAYADLLFSSYQLCLLDYFCNRVLYQARKAIDFK